MMPSSQILKKKILGIGGIRRAAKFVWEGTPRWTVVSITLVVFQSVLPLLSLYSLKLFVDAAVAAQHSANTQAIHHLAVILTYLIGTTLLTAVLRPVSNFVSECQSMQLTDQMQAVVHAKSVQVDLEFYENAAYHDTLQRAQEEAPHRPNQIVKGLTSLAQSAISLIAIGGLLVFSVPKVFLLVLLLSMLPGLVYRLVMANSNYQLRKEQTSNERWIFYYNMLMTLEQFAKEIRLFNLGPLFLARSQDLRSHLRGQKSALVLRRMVGEIVTQICAIGAIYATIAYMTFAAVHHSITLGGLIMSIQALQRGQAALQDFLGASGDLYENNLFINNLNDFLDLTPQLAEPSFPLPTPRPMTQGITLNDVSFRYANGADDVLKNISLTIHAGSTVAIVGENGSGKTTLIKLLCRLYDPTSGAITLDGRELGQYDSEDLRRQIGVVFQDYVHYYATARENIWLGDAQSPNSLESIQEAACSAGAAEVIGGLPRGYDTLLGNWFESGNELSVGQWQKVALARAFFRDAQILVLDEPTSALDANAEHEVFEKFRSLTQDKTAILISHRLSTVKMADCIFVLENGRLVESGSHAELVRNNGPYAQMFNLQARSYQMTT